MEGERTHVTLWAGETMSQNGSGYLSLCSNVRNVLRQLSTKAGQLV